MIASQLLGPVLMLATQAGCTPEHAAMGHCTLAPPEPAAPAAAPAQPASGCTPEHAAMGHCTLETAPATAPAVGNAPPPTARPADQADRHWDPAAMAAARAAMHAEHGGGSFSKVTLDLAEVKFGRGRESYKWEADAWFGGDINRLALKTEGEGDFGGALEEVELTALYSRAIGPYFNLQGGVAHAFGEGPSRTHLVAGIEGLAPYWFEVDTYLYLSSQGELRASAAAEYDQRITQRLILQPKVEFDLSAQDIPALGIGAGVTGAEVGLRLRYEIAREFAPYIGIVHETKIGRTADFARAGGEAVSSTGFVLGLRAWF